MRGSEKRVSQALKDMTVELDAAEATLPAPDQKRSQVFASTRPKPTGLDGEVSPLAKKSKRGLHARETQGDPAGPSLRGREISYNRAGASERAAGMLKRSRALSMTGGLLHRAQKRKQGITCGSTATRAGDGRPSLAGSSCHRLGLLQR